MAELSTIKFPWLPDGEITANLAIGSLRDSLMMWLKSERGVHVETLMVVIGALAGFAAQNAAWGKVETGKPVAKNAFVVAEAGGEKYYFGDLINGYLVVQAGGPEYALWGLIAAAAIQADVPQSQLPDIDDMFRHVTSTIGKPEFGIPRAPADHPTHLTPRRALELFWPRVKFIMSRTDGPGPEKGRGVAPDHWPLVIALVARQFIAMAKDTLDPRIALRLIMESAIAMSKVDPKTIPQTLPDKS